MAESGDRFVLRPFEAEDYGRYSEMWDESEGQVVPPMGSLPLNGIVVGDFLAVGFLASVDCDFGFACWYMVDETLLDKDKYVAVKKLFDGLERIAMGLNKNYIFCFTTKSGMLKLLKRINYEEMGQGHLGKRIQA